MIEWHPAHAGQNREWWKATGPGGFHLCVLHDKDSDGTYRWSINNWEDEIASGPGFPTDKPTLEGTMAMAIEGLRQLLLRELGNLPERGFVILQPTGEAVAAKAQASQAERPHHAGHAAYLIAYLRHNPEIERHAVAHVAIKSDPADQLDAHHGTTYAELLCCKGATYQEANDLVIDTVRRTKGLHWVVPWFADSPGHAEFIRKVRKSFGEAS